MHETAVPQVAFFFSDLKPAHPQLVNQAFSMSHSELLTGFGQQMDLVLLHRMTLRLMETQPDRIVHAYFTAHHVHWPAALTVRRMFPATDVTDS